MKRLFTSGAGIVLVYALLGGAIFLAQVFPQTGVMLMMLGGPLWIGILTHGLMAHLGLAAASGIVARAWLLVPVVYYGAGYALHLESVRRAQAQAEAIAAANAAARVTLEEPFTYLFRYAHEDTLFERYRVARAFITEGDRTYTQYDYARGDACDAANRNWDYNKRGEPYLRRPDLFPSYRGADKIRQCVVARSVASGAWRYRLESEVLRVDDFMNPVSGTHWRIYDASSGALVTSVTAASIAALPPVQTPVAGCTLISSTPAWKCFATLWHSSGSVTAGYRKRVLAPRENPFSVPADPDMIAISALGRALSLPPRSPTQ